MNGEIEIWKTRSFWFAVATAAGMIANMLGHDLDAGVWADRLFALVPLVTLALAYRERMRPTKNVVIGRAKK